MSKRQPQRALMPHLDDAVEKGELTPFEALVCILAHAFLDHFRRTPTVLGPSGAETTPFTRFVIQVCIEADIRPNGRLPTAAMVSDAGRKIGVPEDKRT